MTDLKDIWPPSSSFSAAGMAVYLDGKTVVLTRNEKGEWVDDDGVVYRVIALTSA